MVKKPNETCNIISKGAVILFRNVEHCGISSAPEPVPSSSRNSIVIQYNRPYSSLTEFRQFPEFPELSPDGIPTNSRNSGIASNSGITQNSGNYFRFRNQTKSLGIPGNSVQFRLHSIPGNSAQFRLHSIPGIPCRNCLLIPETNLRSQQYA